MMKHFNAKLLASLLLAFLLAACGDDTPQINNENEFDTYVQEEMKVQGIPALSVLVFRDNEGLHVRFFGAADLQQGAALTSEHLFL
jgi:hypothetical protein